MKRAALLPLLLASMAGILPAQEAKPLFDGKSLAGWVTASGKPAENGKGWTAEDGVLHRASKGGDLYTEKEYGDFELNWEWKIAAGGNSGVKYRVTSYAKELLGPEYQMLDDAKHADGKLGSHRTASIYDLFPPTDETGVKPVGEWNQSKIVAVGTKFEHWINGKKVAECDTSTQAWKDAVAKSKFKTKKDWALNPKGKIMLQDHGDEVWIRNITVKEMAAK